MVCFSVCCGRDVHRKKTKDDEMKAQAREQRRREAEKRRLEEEAQAKKQKDTSAALEAWKEQKDAILRQSTTPANSGSGIEARMVWSPPGAGDGGVLRSGSVEEE